MAATTVTLERNVDVAAAEKLLGSLSRRSLAGPFLLDLSSCERIDIGAGYRIGNLCARLSAIAPLSVAIPSGDYSVDQVPKHFFWIFTRSGVGPALARHAHTITADNNDITAAVKKYYERTLLRPTNSSAYIADLHRGTVDVEDEGRFGRILIGLLQQVDSRTAEIDRRALGDVIAFCFEAVQNVVDHAAKKPLKDGSAVFSYLALRYYGDMAVPSEGPFAGYTKRLSRERQQPSGWLEVVINDDGNGIPARHAQDAEIYWEPSLAREESVLTDALARTSVKIRASDSKVRGSVAGEGFSRIRAALRQLSAFACIRTGRCLATFDGLSRQRDEFHLDRAQFGLSLGYMPGTAVQVVLPITVERKQQQLF